MGAVGVKTLHENDTCQNAESIILYISTRLSILTCSSRVFTQTVSIVYCCSLGEIGHNTTHAAYKCYKHDGNTTAYTTLYIAMMCGHAGTQQCALHNIPLVMW